jgi:hypothetical protein
VLKTYGANKYKWSPEKVDKNKTQNNDNKFYCNAISGSQGQDWISTYSYIINITENGIKEKIAYVECDYVQ